MRERRGRIDAITQLDRGISLVAVTAIDPTPVSWHAGQFVSVRIDDAGARRSYSIVTAARTAESFELLVAAGSPSGGTAAFMADLEPGDEIRYFGPMGYFTYQWGHSGAVFFGATGVGISAVLPMVMSAARDRAPARIEVHWSVRQRSGAVLGDRLEAVAGRDARISVQMYVTGEGDSRLTAPLIDAIAADPDPRIYLCGNPAMVDDVCRGLSEAGVDLGGRVLTELFTPAIVTRQL